MSISTARPAWREHDWTDPGEVDFGGVCGCAHRIADHTLRRDSGQSRHSQTRPRHPRRPSTAISGRINMGVYAEALSGE